MNKAPLLIHILGIWVCVRHGLNVPGVGKYLKIGRIWTSSVTIWVDCVHRCGIIRIWTNDLLDSNVCTGGEINCFHMLIQILFHETLRQRWQQDWREIVDCGQSLNVGFNTFWCFFLPILTSRCYVGVIKSAKKSFGNLFIYYVCWPKSLTPG